MKMTIPLMVALCLCGCQYIDQKVEIAPQLDTTESEIGNGKRVGVKVLDEREDSVIGKRGVGIAEGANIRTEQDIAQVFNDSICNGLRRKGFQPVPYEEGEPASMRVEVRTLKYDVAMGVWTGNNSAESSIKVLAANGAKNYEKLYRGYGTIRTAFHASQETNAKIINAAVNDVLEKVFADRELLEFLAH